MKLADRTPRPAAYGDDAKPRMGFFTDTTVCIGCKACEVACKEWNQIPERRASLTGKSYDNTAALGANTWRHVAFIEQRSRRRQTALLDGRARQQSTLAQTYQEGDGFAG